MVEFPLVVWQAAVWFSLQKVTQMPPLADINFASRSGSGVASIFGKLAQSLQAFMRG
jgi:hypothetical protein